MGLIVEQKQACCTNLLWVALSHYNRQVQMPCPNTVEQQAPATRKPHRGSNQASTLFRRLSGVFLLITTNLTVVEGSIYGTSWARRYCFLPACLLLRMLVALVRRPLQDRCTPSSRPYHNTCVKFSQVGYSPPQLMAPKGPTPTNRHPNFTGHVPDSASPVASSDVGGADI